MFCSRSIESSFIEDINYVLLTWIQQNFVDLIQWICYYVFHVEYFQNIDLSRDLILGLFIVTIQSKTLDDVCQF